MRTRVRIGAAGTSGIAPGPEQGPWGTVWSPSCWVPLGSDDLPDSGSPGHPSHQPGTPAQQRPVAELVRLAPGLQSLRPQHQEDLADVVARVPVGLGGVPVGECARRGHVDRALQDDVDHHHVARGPDAEPSPAGRDQVAGAHGRGAGIATTTRSPSQPARRAPGARHLASSRRTPTLTAMTAPAQPSTGSRAAVAAPVPSGTGSRPVPTRVTSRSVQAAGNRSPTSASIVARATSRALAASGSSQRRSS
jgi:hypothetical protein